MAMTPDGIDTIALRPQFTAPSWLADRRHSFQPVSRSHPFARLDHLRGTLRGNRLHQEEPMLFLGPNVQEEHGIPCGHLHTNPLEYCIDPGVKHNAAIFGRTHPRGHQDGDMVALMGIFAPTSDHHCFKQAKHAAGNLTPRD